MISERKTSKKIQVQLEIEEIEKLEAYARKQKTNLPVLLQVIIRSSCNELERCGEF